MDFESFLIMGFAYRWVLIVDENDEFSTTNLLKNNFYICINEQLITSP